MRLIIAAAALLASLSAAHAEMSVSFEWGPTTKCFDGKSPPMKLRGVPAGTKKLDIRMTDLNMRTFNHGGGKIAYSGDSLPYGAFRYRGPCPPSPHMYEFTVKALDGGGKALATATARKRFP